MAAVMGRAVPLAIVCLVVAGSATYSRHAQSHLPAPAYWFLAILSCLLLWPLDRGAGECLQKAVAAYVVALSVDYLAGVYWPVAEHLQIAAAIVVVAAVALAVVCAGRRPSDSVKAAGLPLAAGLAIGIVALHLLVVSLLVHSHYGYGTQRSLPILGQLAMVLLVAMVGWRLARDPIIRVALGIVGLACYSWMAIS